MSEFLKNSKARRDYRILETFEAGVVLKGTEVKSLRAGKGQIRDAYVKIENGEAWLHNAHIEEYSHGNLLNHKPKAARKLLLHRKEIRQLFELGSIKGHTLVPLSFHWKKGKVKVLVGAGRGKDQKDKRETIKQRDSDRELKRATMQHLKRK